VASFTWSEATGRRVFRPERLYYGMSKNIKWLGYRETMGLAPVFVTTSMKHRSENQTGSEWKGQL